MHTLQFHGSLSTLAATVLSISGVEALNEPFEFTASIRIVRDDIESALHGGPEGAERVLLGQRVTFVMANVDAGTARHGVVSEVVFEGTHRPAGVEMAQFRLQISPQVWLLSQRRNSRIFQGQYVHQIVHTILEEWRIPHRWQLNNSYPRRLYCTQYEETDLEFVQRLLAEEGIVSYFEHVQQFAPDPTAAAAEKEFGWKDGIALAAGLGKAASKIGEAMDQSAVAIGGKALGVLADGASVFLDKEAGEEDDLPINPGRGNGGLPLDNTDVFVFIDMAIAYTDTLGTDGNRLVITRRDPSGLISDDRVVFDFGAGGRLRPRLTETRDYDFRKPLLVLRAGTVEEANRYPELDIPAEIYDHHGEYEKPDINRENVLLHLQQHRADAFLSHAHGISPALIPGHLFRLDNDTTSPVEEVDYAVVRVHHEAISPEHLDGGGSAEDALARGCAEAITSALTSRTRPSEQDLASIIRRAVDASAPTVRPYRNRLECVHADVAFRPRRPERRNRRFTETATVVGPPGQDIHTDRFGRIRVQFHWDREHQFNQKSSIWIRCAQPWSGTGFGFQFIPRIGMEVVVSFVGGDPDRPVVIGTLYNGTHATPEPLPERMTRSAIRTQRSPGGGAFNEISFEDAEGTEKLTLKSAKDMEIVSEDFQTQSVGGDHLVTVAKSQRTGVGKDHITGVGENRVVSVGRTDSTAVGGHKMARVEANEMHSVEGSRLQTVRGNDVKVVKGNEMSLVDGVRNSVTHGDVLVSVTPATHAGSADLVATVADRAALTVGKAAQILVAEDRVDETSVIQLRVGKSIIQVARDSILIQSKEVYISAEDKIFLSQGSDANLELSGNKMEGHADPISLATGSGAELQLRGANAKLFGNSIGLHPTSTSGNESSTTAETPPDNLLLRFTHKTLQYRHEPIKNTKCKINIGKDTISGKSTNESGELDLYAPPTLREAMVTLYVNESYPDVYDGPLEFVVKLVEEFPAETSNPGLHARLANLGFDPGGKLEDFMHDPALERSMAEFQRAKGLEVTGSTLGDNGRDAVKSEYNRTT